MISTEIINFINQTEEIFAYNNLENLKTIYHYSIPNVKLSYPEPFIASASFMHSDLWFVHILIYQYWLWFVFIFIIVFFFITFICTVRWCNMRIKPRRETRGVSRSKCGDLITAIVPVSWATSIIVNESTDAIDYFDGFGTTELVIGIRAYQWGWEYYYPKDIDLNYNIKKNYSQFIGNSLKYNKTTELNLSSNNLWKFYQNKSFDQSIIPAYLLVLPTDNAKLFNFLNFNDIGANTLYEANAFKRIRMFSKTYTSNLFLFNNNFNSKYKTLTNLYVNSNDYLDSYNYGVKRQHNFLSFNSLLPNQKTFLDINSFNKLTSFNFNIFNKKFNSLALFQNFNYINKILENNSYVSFFSLTNNFFEKKNFKLNNQFFKNFINYNEYLEKINNNTERKKILHPIQKLFNKKFKKEKSFNFFDNNLINSFHDVNFFKNLNEENLFLNNSNKFFKTSSIFSSNQSISLSDKTLRNFSKISPNFSTLNYSQHLNQINNYIDFNKTQLELNNLFFYNASNLNWIDLYTSSKLINSKTIFDYPYSPVTSNNPLLNHFKFDSLKHTFVEGTPTMFQGKEELLSSFIPLVYWNFFWNHSGTSFKIKNLTLSNSLTSLSYLPLPTLYYDYDFRNWQFLELFEDAYWESIYSIYTYDEYLLLTKNFYEYEYFDKYIKLFNEYNKLWTEKNENLDVMDLPLKKTFSSLFDAYAYSFYSDEYFNNNSLYPSKDFFIYPNFINFFNNDDNYDTWKNISYLFSTNFVNSSNLSWNFFNAMASSAALDSFRSDFDEFSWFIEDSNFLNKHFSNFSKLLTISDATENLINSELILNNNLIKNDRFSNNINLRNTAKNSIVTFNAIQKVFKTRFDENRSHARFTDLNNFYVKQPFISTPRSPWEKALGKNKENFYKTMVYKNKTKKFINSFYFNNSSTNFYFFDFPFLMALKSDSARYLWFDWYAKWGFLEVQPSSSSRYAIHGMPYFFKLFEYSISNNENLNETETYLIRIAKARKNYLPNWAYTPYFYAKNNFWYKNHIAFSNFTNFTNQNELITTKHLLANMNWYWLKYFYFDFNIRQFFPSTSNINSYSKGSWKPQNSIQAYYYTLSNLTDILTKREYLIRELLVKKNKIINLPNSFTNSPNNPLINEIKANFLFFDIINKNNEYSRDLFYTSLNFFNFIVINELLKDAASFLPLSPLTNFFYFYFTNSKNLNFENINKNNELYKNQYRPLRKGITNMIRLHATGAMALTTEIRLQILASSKDVIHSWAIPSAGIKIDCIPGYSSHRVMIFLVSGIFWGQCMEICGRYHHWMPIVVYFMKRDLFFLWCTHFIFLSGSNNQWNINDRQYTDYARVVSFDKLSWITEINN